MLRRASGRHRHVPDRRVPEGGSGEQGVESGEDGHVRAPVGVHRPALEQVLVLHRVDVGLDITAAKSIDGLLRITHHHQGGAGVRLAEESLEDPPLDRVGVLELVDQRHLVATAKGLDGRRRARAGQGAAQVDEHAVETGCPLLAPAVVEPDTPIARPAGAGRAGRGWRR